MLFSIIIPAFKAQHLRQAVQSVLAQSCGDYELLVVDDSPHELKTELTDFHDHRIYYCLETMTNWHQIIWRK